VVDVRFVDHRRHGRFEILVDELGADVQLEAPRSLIAAIVPAPTMELKRPRS
jgi:hypothetical protein